MCDRKNKVETFYFHGLSNGWDKIVYHFQFIGLLYLSQPVLSGILNHQTGYFGTLPVEKMPRKGNLQNKI